MKRKNKFAGENLRKKIKNYEFSGDSKIKLYEKKVTTSKRKN